MNKLEEIRQIPDPVRQLLKVMEKLRAPDGCPWDREQTHESLSVYLREECAEVVDTVIDKDYPALCDELGDLLMNIVFSSLVAAEEGLFDLDDVARGSVEKMIRRHPHVFGEVMVNGSGDVLTVWEDVKRAERGNVEPESILDKVPRSLPALLRATEVQKKVAKVGFDWDGVAPIVDKIEEELREVEAALQEGCEDQIEEEIGDLLFAVVNLARFRKRSNAEDMLLRAVKKFERRFRFVENELKQRGTFGKASLEEMDAAWNEAKRRGV